MSEGFEPFIKGLYDAAPKCKKCGEPREYWDDKLCTKCRTQEFTKERFGRCPLPLLSKKQIEEIRKEMQSDEHTIPIVCLPPITREDIIWAIRHPNRKRKVPNVIELKHELTPEEEETLIKLIDYHKETLKLLAE